MNFIISPWPWFVGGPLIGLMIPLLLLAGNKQLGISSSLRHICAACAPARLPFFQYDWKKYTWNLFFVAGIAIGGYLAYLTTPEQYAIAISPETKTDLISMGISNFSGMIPAEIFSWPAATSGAGIAFILLGGFLIGFGTRYANGCTSGHTIMGISNLRISSLIATIAFFAGGLIMTHFILPFILS